MRSFPNESSKKGLEIKVGTVLKNSGNSLLDRPKFDLLEAEKIGSTDGIPI